jgi:transcriptional antiterminator RfaH
MVNNVGCNDQAGSSLLTESSRNPVGRHQDTARWFVIYTRPRAEEQAIFHLRRQGYTVFCPLIRRAVRHARKTSLTLSPLFPSYLFIRLDAARDRWRSVNGTFGVVQLISIGDMPQPVPTGIVEVLQERIGADGILNWSRNFVPGQPVRIVGGPFSDLAGTLERLDSAGRVRVLLNLLGRSVSVAVSRDALKTAV